MSLMLVIVNSLLQPRILLLTAAGVTMGTTDYKML